jgi:Skp family chaperone for outer membrane proteins
MTEQYRQTELAKARKELEAAQAKLSGLKTWNDDKRDAAEEVEFWGNKVAFLANVRP